MQDIKFIDFSDFESLLSEDEKMIMNMGKDFVNKEVLPVIEEAYSKDEFPKQLIPKMAELGFFGANLEGYGCAGLGDVAYGLLTMMMEAGDSGLRSFVSVQGSLVMYPIHAFGSEEQKEKWLPKLAAGEKIGCFGLTEPDHGSNPANMDTKAVKVDGGYKLNGAKMWITNGSIADIAVVWAMLDGEVTGFLVEKGMKGFETRLMKNKHSLRASVTSELIFDDCVVPEENVLPKTLKGGLKYPLKCLTQARHGIAWGVIGSAMACYNEALNYAMSRIQFHGQPIASHQLVQQKLVHMLTEITKALYLTLHIGRQKEQGKLKHEYISMIKMNNVRMALDIARTARDILGANGISGEYPIMRHMCNLESVLTYEGTENIHTLILGKSITGIAAF